MLNLLSVRLSCVCGSMVKNLPAMQAMQVQSLGQEDPLEKEMATHSSILAWEILWTEEPGGLQSMGKQKSDTTECLENNSSCVWFWERLGLVLYVMRSLWKFLRKEVIQLKPFFLKITQAMVWKRTNKREENPRQGEPSAAVRKSRWEGQSLNQGIEAV